MAELHPDEMTDTGTTGAHSFDTLAAHLDGMDVSTLQAIWAKASQLLKVDFIGKLPVPLAHKVLSHLSVEEIVRAGFVSRVW